MKYIIKICHKNRKVIFSTERDLNWYSGAVSIAERLLKEKTTSKERKKGAYYKIKEQ